MPKTIAQPSTFAPRNAAPAPNRTAVGNASATAQIPAPPNARLYGILRSAKLGSGTLAPADMLTLQRTMGNQAVHRLLTSRAPSKPPDAAVPEATDLGREAHPSASSQLLNRQPASQPVPSAAASVPPALLHQIGLDAINTYYGAAVRGIDIFVRDMAPSFNWAAFGGGVLGSLIWAAACFETGGTAFAISLAGIGLGGATQLPQFTGEAFSAAAEKRTEDLVKGMRNEVTNDGDAIASEGAAATPAWSENQSRMQLLKRIGFRQDHLVTAAGGLPDVDAAAITATTRSELLLKANAWHMGVIGMTGGEAFYRYDLSDFRESEYLGLSHKATPVSSWKATPLGTGVFAPEGGDDALDNIRKGKPGPMKIRDWPVRKTIIVPGDSIRRLHLEYVAIHLGPDNAIDSVELEGIFKDCVKDNGLDEKEYARQIIAKVWGSANSPPPDMP